MILIIIKGYWPVRNLSQDLGALIKNFWSGLRDMGNLLKFIITMRRGIILCLKMKKNGRSERKIISSLNINILKDLEDNYN